MANIELILNPRISPVYVTATNMVLAVTTLTFNDLYQKLSSFISTIINIIQISFYTCKFIVEQFSKEIYEYPLTTQKIVGILGLFMLLVLERNNNKIHEQKNTINSLQKQIHMLEIVSNDNIKTENTKYSMLEKKIKKIEAKVSRLEKDMKEFD